MVHWRHGPTGRHGNWNLTSLSWMMEPIPWRYSKTVQMLNAMQKDYKIATKEVTKNSKVTAKMSSGGGWVAILSKAGH